MATNKTIPDDNDYVMKVIKPMLIAAGVSADLTRDEYKRRGHAFSYGMKAETLNKLSKHKGD